MMKFFSGDSPERQIDRLLAQGERLFQHGKQREGIEKFVEAAEILPEASKPSVYLGRAFFKRQEYDLALKHYYKGLYFCEMHEEPGILCEIAQVYLNMRRYDIAEEKLKKALQLDEYFPLAMKGLIHIDLLTGRYSDALEYQKLLQQHEPDEVQNTQKIAESYRLLGEYQNARDVMAATLDRLHSSGRSVEIEQLESQLRDLSFPDGTEFGMKERLCARYGTLCLGAANDFSIEFSSHPQDTISLHDLMVTLKRLLEFVRVFSWDISCVVSCDKNSGLLALLLAALLNVPLKNVSKVTKSDRVFMCQLVLRDAKHFRSVLKKLGRRTSCIITFAFMAILDEIDQEYVPDIIGLPFEQDPKNSWVNTNGTTSKSFHEAEFFGATSAGPLDASIQQLVDTVYQLPDEEDFSRQTHYYSCEPALLRQHLRGEFLPEDERPEPAVFALEPLVEGLLSSQRGRLYATLRQIQTSGLADPELFETLKTVYLDHEDLGVRDRVGDVLVAMEREAGMEFLLSLFYQTDPADVDLQKAVLTTLCRFPERKIAEVIVAALQSPYDDLRLCASHYLELLDRSQDVTTLLQRLLRDLPDITVRTIRYLGAYHPRILHKELFSLLRSDASEVIHEALRAVQFLQERTCLRFVLLLLRHPERQIVAHAIETLGYVGNMDSAYHLLPFLEHHDPQLRYAAAASLIKLDHQRSIVFLMERLRKEALEVQEKLLTLLGEVGLQETIPFIVQFAEQHLEHPQIVSAAMKTFALLRNPRSLPFVRKAAAKFPNEEILSCYISIASVIGEEKDTETLITFLGHPPAIQFRVAALLYRKGMTRYFHILQDGIRSKKISANLLALEVLAEIPDDASFQLMISAFHKQIPAVDAKIVAMLFRQQHQTGILPHLLEHLQEADTEPMIQGVRRALTQSQTPRDVSACLEVLSLFLKDGAVPEAHDVVRHAPTDWSGQLRSEALQWAVKHDAAASQTLLQSCLNDEDLHVANMAHTLSQDLSFAEV